MNDATTRELPIYQCHKKVRALKIEKVTEPSTMHNESDGSGVLHFCDSRYAPRPVSREYMRKHDPQPGGYFVMYDSKYESWSPAKEFEDGYTLIP